MAVVVSAAFIFGEWALASGLLALLDDVASLAKVAATSIDDVVAHAGKASIKAAGVVIDDAAVTPRYVVGFAAKRELPILAKIAAGSLKNKLLILLPVALLLSFFAPWTITPLLMVGGLYLCFEGTEKIWESFAHQPHAAAGNAAPQVIDAKTFENEKVAGAIATDFILSAEIMALTLASLAGTTMLMKATVLAVVGLILTVLVYGTVALIVKADDAGIAMMRDGKTRVTRAIGRGLVEGMPAFLAVLSVIGTAAMIWVGGGIILHGFEEYGLKTVPHAIHAMELSAVSLMGPFGGLTAWAVNAFFSGIIGLIAGALLIPIVSLFSKPAAHA